MNHQQEKICLILAENGDIHAETVLFELRKIGGYGIILDLKQFRETFDLVSIVDNSGFSYRIEFLNGVSINSGDVGSVWWRKRRRPSASDLIRHPTIRKFSVAECEQALIGSLLSSNSKFINPPHIVEHASYKPLQLKIAQELGLNIPRTIISNKEFSVREFLRVNGNSIYKPFTGIGFGAYETRPILSADLEFIGAVRDCPPIIQEHVEGDFDIRATVVGECVLSAKIMFREGRHPVDSRSDIVPIHPHSLDLSIAKKLISFNRRLGLTYGAYDLRYSDQAGYTFFEVNPSGQYLWIEMDTGLPISKSIAMVLNNSFCEVPEMVGVQAFNAALEEI